MLICNIYTTTRQTKVKPFVDYAAAKAYSRDKNNQVYRMTDRNGKKVN